jgi:hypothetical protein
MTCSCCFFLFCMFEFATAITDQKQNLHARMDSRDTSQNLTKRNIGF